MKEIKSLQTNSENKQPSNIEAEQSLIGSVLVNNDIIDDKIYNYKGVVVEKSSYEYLEYDVNKNWVKRIVYRNDNPLVIEERDVKYYK